MNQADENMRRVRAVLQAVWAIEIMRSMSKEAQIKAKQIKETLDAGKKVIFVKFRSQLVDAIRLCIKLAQDKIDIYVCIYSLQN